MPKGCEISFTRHFYKHKRLRTLEEISADILAIEREAEGLLDGLLVRRPPSARSSASSAARDSAWPRRPTPKSSTCTGTSAGTCIVEHALSRALSPAAVAKYVTQLPDKRLLAAKLQEFDALSAPEGEVARPVRKAAAKKRGGR